MSRAIHIPHRDRDESLIDVAGHARMLDAEDRDVTRQVVLDARLAGDRTAGDLIDRLAAMEPVERRQMLDIARVECGLEPTAAVDARERSTAAKIGSAPASGNPLLHSCSAAKCRAIPQTEAGAWREVNVRRWWCEQHRHLAGEDDMRPVPLPWKLSPSGSLIPNDEADEASEAARVESRRAELAARDDESAAEAATMAATEQAMADRIRRETPAGVPAP